MRDFSSFDDYLSSSKKQSQNLEQTEELCYIPTGYVTMKEIIKFSKTLPKYSSDINYIDNRKIHEAKRVSKNKFVEFFK